MGSKQAQQAYLGRVQRSTPRRTKGTHAAVVKLLEVMTCNASIEAGEFHCVMAQRPKRRSLKLELHERGITTVCLVIWQHPHDTCIATAAHTHKYLSGCFHRRMRNDSIYHRATQSQHEVHKRVTASSIEGECAFLGCGYECLSITPHARSPW